MARNQVLEDSLVVGSHNRSHRMAGDRNPAAVAGHSLTADSPPAVWAVAPAKAEAFLKPPAPPFALAARAAAGCGCAAAAGLPRPKDMRELRRSGAERGLRAAHEDAIRLRVQNLHLRQTSFEAS